MAATWWRKDSRRCLVSPSSDGEFVALALEYAGFPAIRMSTAKKGDSAKARAAVAAFREAVQHVAGGGVLIITPDGPRGPNEEIAAGALQIAKRIEKAGGELMTVKDTIDTSSPMGRFFFTMVAAIAEMEREWIAERTSDAMKSHQANGRRMSNRTPYGWKRDPERPSLMIEDAQEQECLAFMRTQIAAGVSNYALAQKLVEGGFTPRNGRAHWDLTILRRILKRL
jgi:hypothetical protein